MGVPCQQTTALRERKEIRSWEIQEMRKYKLTKGQQRYLSIKYSLDFIIGVVVGIFLLPVMVVIGAVIKVDSPGPVFFRQKRVGRDRKPFLIWKFRTMRIDTPQNIPTHLLQKPEKYITRVGKILRKTSLDELPQIYQLILGDRPLSLCGPRPALWNQHDLIMEREKYAANSVKPGITGWAQINGRDELEIKEKARLDGYYIRKLGAWMDIKCLLGTIGSVLRSDGVIEGGHQKDGDRENSL